MESFSLNELAREHERTRRLVASLVGNADLGEDAVQDAWVKLLERATERGSSGSPRSRGAWLSVAARRFAWNERRRAGRQRQREQSSARDEALPSSAEIASRSEISRRVMATLESLEEPHASVLRDHYFGGLSAAEIGRRDDLPADTIRSRIRRARAKLRERLEDDGLGGDVHWSLAAAPFVLGVNSAPLVPTAAAVALPTTLLMKKLAASVAVAFAALAITLVYHKTGERQVPPNQVDSEEVTSSSGRTDTPSDPPPDPADVAQLEVNRQAADVSRNAPRMLRVLGNVVDGDWRPIDGALAKVWSIGDWPEAADTVVLAGRSRVYDGVEARSDSNGALEFELPLPVPGQTQLIVSASRHQTIHRETVTERKAPITDPEEGPRDLGSIQLGDAGAIIGRVTTENGEPIEGALIFIESDEYGAIGEQTMSGPDGHYVVGHTPAGVYTVYATKGAFLDGVREDVAARLREDTVGIDFVLGSAPTISGRVVDENGAPLSNVRITCSTALKHGRSTDTTSQEGGIFSLHAKSLEPHKLWVRQRGFELIGGDELDELRVEPGDDDVELVLRRLTEFQVYVVDAESDEPISHYGIERLPNAGSESPEQVYNGVGRPRIRERDAGRASIHGSARIDQIIVAADGYKRQRIDLAPDDAGGLLQTIRLERIEQRPNSIVRGRVVRSGQPVEGVKVVLEAGMWSTRNPLEKKGVFLPVDGSIEESESGPDGRFEIPKTSGRKWRVTAIVPNQLVATHELSYADSADIGDLILGPFGSIEGHVLVPDGQVPEGLKVMLDEWFDSPSTVTGSGGRFRFDSVASGLHGLIVRGRDQALESVEDHVVEVTSGEICRTTIDATGHGIARMELTVTVDGAPVPGLKIDAEPIRPVRFQGRRKIGNFGVCDDAGRVEGHFRTYPLVGVGMYVRGTGTLYHPEVLLEPELDKVKEYSVDFVRAEATFRLPADVQLPANAYINCDIYRSDRSMLLQHRSFTIEDGALCDRSGEPTDPIGRELHVDDLLAGSQFIRVSVIDRDSIGRSWIENGKQLIAPSPHDVFLEAEMTLRKGPSNVVELRRVDPPEFR